MFHNKSCAFYNADVIQHKPYEVNIDLANKGNSDATYIIADKVENNKPINKYLLLTSWFMNLASRNANCTMSLIHTASQFPVVRVIQNT